MQLRNLSKDDIEYIITKPEQHFYDIQEGTEIATGKIRITGKEKFLIVAYTVRKEDIFVVTAYPCTELKKELKTKIREKRWISLK